MSIICHIIVLTVRQGKSSTWENVLIQVHKIILNYKYQIDILSLDKENT